MLENRQADVTILGAGIIGLCCALSLQKRGLSVELIDRKGPGEETSYGNAGVISPWSTVPQCMPGVWKQVPKWLIDPLGPVRFRWQYLDHLIPWAFRFFCNTSPGRVKAISAVMALLMNNNITAYRELLKNTGQEHLLLDSWFINVFKAKSQPKLNDLTWRLRIEQGAPVEIIGQQQLKEIEPAISDDYDNAVIIKGQARAFSPGALCKALAEKAMNQGASFKQADIKKLELSAEGNYHLVTPEKEIRAKRLILCAGIWSSELLKPFDFKLPLIAERGYHLEFLNPGVEINNSIQDVASKFIVSSMSNGIRSAGTSEFAAIDAPPNYRRSDILKPLTKRLLPALNINQTKKWMGIRPSFPDNLPVIDRIPQMCNLYAAFGHSHYGLGMAPATGEIMAELITDKAASPTNFAISIQRFT